MINDFSAEMSAVLFSDLRWRFRNRLWFFCRVDPKRDCPSWTKPIDILVSSFMVDFFLGKISPSYRKADTYAE